MFSIMLTACGGGGGGSTTPAPVAPGPGAGGGGGNATPSPAPTGGGGGGSTPTPTPTVAPQGSTILPDTTGRFSMIQLADQYGYNNSSLSSGQIQSEAGSGTYNAVWAAFQPSTWTQYNSSGSTMILSRYYVPFEDAYLISGHDITWFQQNHPDWILYGCQSNGTPTSDYAWTGTLAAFGKDVPLNIHNPAVVQYEMGVLSQYLSANGYNALAIDQVVFIDFLQSPNPNLEGSGPNSGWYGCGVYPNGPSNGNFQRVYGPPSGGNLDQPDATLTNDLLNWVNQAKTTLGPLGIKILVNHPQNGASPSGNDATLISYVDGVVDENGFSNYGQFGPDTKNPGDFANTLSWVQAVQGMGKAVWLADYYNNNGGSSASSLSGAEVDFALATYALANNGGLGLYTAPLGVGQYSYRGEYADRYGAACGPVSQSGSLYIRKFANGLAVVNNSASAQSYTLPNHTYADIEQGHINISGPGAAITINGGDGAMLLLNPASGNGCS